MERRIPAAIALATLGVALVLSTTAHAAVTSNLHVKRVKTYNGGTIHVTFDRAVCGSQTWAKISPSDVGIERMLNVAIAARLSGIAVDVDVIDSGGGGANCALQYIQLQE